MLRSTPLHIGETYHVFNRGAHKAAIFKTDGERERFQALLLVCNQSDSIHMGNLLAKYKGRSFIKIFEEQVPNSKNRLVDVLAYSLMPNHFHLVVRQNVHDGISTFMRKLGTSYAMYYNARHDHSGTLFQGRFKSEHVDTDRYLLWLMRYVHLNALDLMLLRWRENGVRNLKEADKFLRQYRWSSRVDYHERRRPEGSLVTLSDTYDPKDLFSDVDAVRENIKNRRENIKDRPLYLV